MKNNSSTSERMMRRKGAEEGEKEKDKEKDKEYNSTKNYKPVGIYNSDILQKIQNKFTT